MKLTVRQLLRLAGLFVALIVLLTCYQFLGKAMLQAFSTHNEPVIWISLTSPPQNPIDNKRPEVQQEDAEFTVIAPPGRSIVLSNNRSELERRLSSLTPTVFHVALR